MDGPHRGSLARKIVSHSGFEHFVLEHLFFPFTTRAIPASFFANDLAGRLGGIPAISLGMDIRIQFSSRANDSVAHGHP